MHTTCLRFSAKNSQFQSAKVLSCTQSAKIDTEWLVIMKGIVVTLIWVNDELALNTSCNGLFALLRLLSVSQSRQFLQTDLQIAAIKLDIASTALIFYGRVLNRILYSHYIVLLTGVTHGNAPPGKFLKFKNAFSFILAANAFVCRKTTWSTNSIWQPYFNVVEMLQSVAIIK